MANTAYCEHCKKRVPFLTGKTEEKETLKDGTPVSYTKIINICAGCSQPLYVLGTEQENARNKSMAEITAVKKNKKEKNKCTTNL